MTINRDLSIAGRPIAETIARRHPELEQEIRTEINRVLVKKGVLVHGDYSPKNILLFPDRKDLALDGEVAHIGNPSFDTAFLLNHLLLKVVRQISPGRHAGGPSGRWVPLI